MRNRNQLRCNHNKKYTKDGTTNSSTQQKASKGKIDSLRISCCFFCCPFVVGSEAQQNLGEKNAALFPSIMAAEWHGKPTRTTTDVACVACHCGIIAAAAVNSPAQGKPVRVRGRKILGEMWIRSKTPRFRLIKQPSRCAGNEIWTARRALS